MRQQGSWRPWRRRRSGAWSRRRRRVSASIDEWSNVDVVLADHVGKLPHDDVPHALALQELDCRNKMRGLEAVAPGFVRKVFILARANLFVERYRGFHAEAAGEIRVRQFGQ